MKNDPENEIKVLLEILKGISGKGISFESINTGRLIQLAGLHRVSYQLLVFAQDHPGMLTPQQSELLANRCRKNAITALDQLHELVSVTRNLQKAGISSAIIKGPQLARMIYGREALKESVDLDIILLQASDLETTHDVLTGMGYTHSNLNSHPGKLSRKIFLIAKREVHYFNQLNKSQIDLHLRAGANTYLTAGLFRNYFNKTETYDLDGCQVNVLPPEEYLAYLFYHGSLHLFSRLAWLMDIRALMAIKKDELNYGRVLAIAKGIRMERSLYLGLALLHEFFGDEIPSEIEKSMVRNRRIDYLAKKCMHLLSRDGKYGLTPEGRMNKLIYMMVLIKGFAGRIDLVYGIVMRVLATHV